MRSKIWLIVITAGVVLCSFSAAQDSMTSQTDNAASKNQQTQEQPAQSEPSPSVPRIAPGSVIPVRLTKTVDAKKAKTGDEVDAVVTQDLKSLSGEVVVSKDTKVVGHITEAQARSKEQKESQLGIAFDHAVMKDGGIASLRMSIQAVIAQTGQNPENANSEGAEPTSATGAGLPQANGAGRPGGMGAGTPQQTPSAYPAGGEQPSSDSTGRSAHQAVTVNTEGIVGMSDYKLSTAGEATQGSVVSSEKGNVTLASGTLMLLRVNQ